MTADLRELVRERIRDGVLPREYMRVWGGPGTETPCTGCRMPTKMTGMEFDCIAPDGRSVVMCKPCFFLWMQETGG